ncbi:MAG TPA: sugar ABC transporter substrate-binding protein [Gemmatimonadota bacterium]|nr:sugar ABC transporter substrate-binding protein [Gemmatimonadota bacterium]
MNGKIRMTAILGMALAIAPACNRQGGPSGGPTVALVLKTLNNPFFIDMEAGAREAADSLGLELLVQAPDREIDVEKQMQIVENLLQTDVDALLLTPSGSREIVPAVVKANQAGIPVVVVDTRVDAEALAAAGGRVQSFIGSDNVDGGRIAGQFVARALDGQGRVAVIEGIPGHETGDSRLRGFRETMAGHPGIEIVASQTANWERDQAFNVTQNILQSHPDLDALFAANDVMALGAVEAVAAAGRAGDILIVGFDAQEEAQSAIRDGRMAASIAQHPREMGRLAVESAWRLLHGESVPAEQPVKIELVTETP